VSWKLTYIFTLYKIDWKLTRFSDGDMMIAFLSLNKKKLLGWLIVRFITTLRFLLSNFWFVRVKVWLPQSPFQKLISLPAPMGFFRISPTYWYEDPRAIKELIHISKILPHPFYSFQSGFPYPLELSYSLFKIPSTFSISKILNYVRTQHGTHINSIIYPSSSTALNTDGMWTWFYCWGLWR